MVELSIGGVGGVVYLGGECVGGGVAAVGRTGEGRLLVFRFSL